MKHIFLQIKLEQTKLGWTDYELAKQSGVDKATLSRYFKGDNWTRDNLVKLLKAVKLNRYIELLEKKEY
jgi:transcriptional regulator with XRE-family HTH domain